MNKQLRKILDRIGDRHRDNIMNSGRHYLEVNIGREAQQMGVNDLPDLLGSADVVVPLKAPVSGMKVRIDGRTFVDYASFESGLAVPGYVARAAGLPHKTYTAQDSMVLNFTG